MRGLRLATLLGAFGIALSAGGDAAAQTPYLLVPEQPLQFGPMTPGAPQSVSPTDVARRGELSIQGQGATMVVFTLPQHLESVSGARIPLSFAGTDGRLQVKNRVLVFDPAHPLAVRINPSEGVARIFLGGTALPAPGQPAGSYSATITVMTVLTGT